MSKNTRKVTVESTIAMTEAERIAYEENLCWQLYDEEKAKEAKRVQSEIDMMYEEATQNAEVDDDAVDDNSPEEEDTSPEEMIQRKAAALIRRKKAKKTKRETAAKAEAAKANLAKENKKAVAAGRTVPDSAKKGYYSLLSRGAKFAGVK